MHGANRFHVILNEEVAAITFVQNVIDNKADQTLKYEKDPQYIVPQRRWFLGTKPQIHAINLSILF